MNFWEKKQDLSISIQRWRRKNEKKIENTIVHIKQKVISVGINSNDSYREPFIHRISS